MPRPRKSKVGVAGLARHRRFVLIRSEDVSGTSGTGVVAEGVRLSNGQAVLHWLTQLSSVGIYHSVDILVDIHGHEGATVLKWIDEESENGGEKREENQ